MKILLTLLFAALSLTCIAGLGDSLPTAKNSVPVSMGIYFFSSTDRTFRLSRSEGYTMTSGVCRLETSTRYTRYQDDEDADEVDLRVSDGDWVRFREALRGLGMEKMKKAGREGSAFKSWVWAVRIVYPDTEIDILEADAPELEAQFAELKKAISELIAQNRPNQSSEPTAASGRGSP